MLAPAVRSKKAEGLVKSRVLFFRIRLLVFA